MTPVYGAGPRPHTTGDLVSRPTSMPWKGAIGNRIVKPSPEATTVPSTDSATDQVPPPGAVNAISTTSAAGSGAESERSEPRPSLWWNTSDPSATAREYPPP